jgi:hypothetical protein
MMADVDAARTRLATHKNQAVAAKKIDSPRIDQKNGAAAIDQDPPPYE